MMEISETPMEIHNTVHDTIPTSLSCSTEQCILEENFTSIPANECNTQEYPINYQSYFNSYHALFEFETLNEFLA